MPPSRGINRRVLHIPDHSANTAALPGTVAPLEPGKCRVLSSELAPRLGAEGTPTGCSIVIGAVRQQVGGRLTSRCRALFPRCAARCPSLRSSAPLAPAGGGVAVQVAYAHPAKSKGVPLFHNGSAVKDGRLPLLFAWLVVPGSRHFVSPPLSRLRCTSALAHRRRAHCAPLSKGAARARGVSILYHIRQRKRQDQGKPPRRVLLFRCGYGFGQIPPGANFRLTFA